MGNCSTCPSRQSCGSKDTSKSQSCGGKQTTKHGKISNIIGVISGKGGVGKSTVTGIMAIELAKKGFKVGVLDADITGPSMPRFFGINEERAMMAPTGIGNETKFIPVETELGIKVISINLLTEKEEQPVIWRSPVINGVLNQMFTETAWEDLDYLLIDMPPGTGDIALTVMQSFPLTSMVIVATPQDMVSMIVKKVVIMTEKLGVPVKGVVENMSYIRCGNCNEKIRIFSKKSAEEHAEYLGIPLIAELPINLDLSESLEAGKVEDYIKNNTEYENVIKAIL